MFQHLEIVWMPLRSTSEMEGPFRTISNPTSWIGIAIKACLENIARTLKGCVHTSITSLSNWFHCQTVIPLGCMGFSQTFKTEFIFLWFKSIIFCLHSGTTEKNSWPFSVMSL